jgi:hypothetical protein
MEEYVYVFHAFHWVLILSSKSFLIHAMFILCLGDLIHLFLGRLS